MTILDLMERRWAAADEAESLALQTAINALQLVTAQRHARESADALADALTKESGTRLCKILQLENPGPPSRDISRPKRRARKGEKRGSP